MDYVETLPGNVSTTANLKTANGSGIIFKNLK
jgi:hypothetical protein